MSQWDITAGKLLISEKVDLIMFPMIHLFSGLHNALQHTEQGHVKVEASKGKR